MDGGRGTQTEQGCLPAPKPRRALRGGKGRPFTSREARACHLPRSRRGGSERRNFAGFRRQRGGSGLVGAPGGRSGRIPARPQSQAGLRYGGHCAPGPCHHICRALYRHPAQLPRLAQTLERRPAISAAPRPPTSGSWSPTRATSSAANRLWRRMRSTTRWRCGAIAKAPSRDRTTFTRRAPTDSLAAPAFKRRSSEGTQT